MWLSYIKVALRSLIKQRLYAFINIVGLAIGVTTCILILMFVRYEQGFDRFNENADNIYRLNLEGKLGDNEFRMTNSTAPAGPTMLEEYPEVVNYTRIRNTGFPVLRYGDKVFSEELWFQADSTVFEVFTIPMLIGDPKTALTQPLSVVITERMAKKYFGDEDPLGKVLNSDNVVDFTVTGVVQELPDDSHWHFDFLGSMVTYGDSRNPMWLNNNFQTYLQLAEGASAAEFEAKQALQSEYTAKLSYVGTVNSYRNSLDNLKQKLALPLNTNLKLDFKVLDDLRDMGLPEMPLDEISGYRLALDNRLDLMNVIDRFEDSKRKVKVAKSDLLPGLSIVADAALRDQFYSSFQADSIETKAGLKLNLPFDRLSERNAYRSSLIAFERQLRTLSTELDKVLDGLRSDLRNLSRQRQNYFTQLEARKNAEENLEATRQRLRLGFPGVRTRDVITAQDALLQSQLSVLGAGLEHHKTRLKLLKDIQHFSLYHFSF